VFVVMSLSVLNLDRRFVQVSKDASELDTDVPFLRALGSRFYEGWDELLASPCVVVLGEAGTGKTTEFREQARLRKQNGESAFFVPIEDLADDEFLGYSDLQDFESWKTADIQGYFFLDSLDEARLRHGSLRKSLRKLSHALGPAAHRARLLVSCRVSDWRFDADRQELETFVQESRSSKANDTPSSPEQSLVHVVQLAPLEPEQVRALASHHGVTDLDSLDQAIHEAHAHAFVERPQDVEWLCSYWTQNHRLGSLSDLIESNIAEKLRERPERRSDLTPERAREGAMLLAGIAMLCAQRSVALPENRIDPSHTIPAIDPRAVLKDWSDAEIEQLLTRPIFDESTYGRVRIHHRTVQEYLGARWLQGLLEQGMPRRHLYNLLFPSVAGDTIVPDHLQAPVAWLALWDDGVRRRVVKAAPQILIGLGDPSQLNHEERSHLLRAYAAQYTDRTRRYEHFDRASLARFASPTLVGLIDELLRDPAQPDELRVMLLEMLSEKKLDACVPMALHVALDPGTSTHVRHDAISAVAKVGTLEQKRDLLGLLDHLHQWDQDVAGCFIAELFPDLLDIAGLLRVLERVHGVRVNIHTRLQSVLEYNLPRNLDIQQRVVLLDALLGFVTKGSEGTKPRSLRFGRTWLLPTMGYLLVALLDDPRRDQSLPAAAVETLELYRDIALPSWEYRETELRDALSRHADVRQELFWRYIERCTAETGKIPTRYRDIPYDRLLPEQRNDDFTWLEQDVSSRPLVQERLLAFDVLLYVPMTEAQRERRDKLLHEIAAKDKALEKRLQRLRNPPFDMKSKATIAGYRRRDHVRSNRHARVAKEKLAALTSNMEKIRSGQHFNALWFLFRASTTTTNDEEASVTRVQEKYGDDIANAFRAGMKTFWRSYEPPLRHELEENTGTPYAVVLGLAGLTLEVEDGLDIAILDDELVPKAVRYAAWKLNSFPPWLEVIAQANPTLVRQTLQAAVAANYACIDDDQHFRDIIVKLVRAPEPVRRACAPVIADLLRSGEPPLLHTLGDVIEVLLSISRSDSAVLDELAEERCKDAVTDPERLAFWWCTWLERKGAAALDFLQQSLEPLEEPAAYKLVETICNRLHAWTHRVSKVRITFNRVPHVLARLIPLVSRYIDPDHDLKHEGVYSPGPRDNAQDIRYTLVSWLSENSSEEAVRAFQAIAQVPEMAKYRDWFLHKAEQAAGRADSIAPMSPDQALEWGHEHVSIIRSSDDLFRVACDRLDDIRLEMEQGDFTYRELFNQPGKEVQEPHAQKWLVSELRRRAQGRYSTTPEEEIDRKERPDIRLYHPECSGPVSIEVKIYEKWTYQQLAYALENQLVGKYLRAATSNHGIFLLCAMGAPVRKKTNGRFVSFAEVQAALAKEAERIIRERADAVALRVVGIDFHDTVSPSKTGGAAGTGKGKKARSDKNKKSAKSDGTSHRKRKPRGKPVAKA
jgi:hypothetical protein